MNFSDIREKIEQINEKIEIYLSVNRFDAAEKLLRASIADYGSISNLHNLLGITFHKQSKFTEALIEFNKALVTNPNFLEAGLNLTVTLCDLSRYDEARNIFSKLTEIIYSNRQTPSLLLGRLANQHGKLGKSYELCGMANESINEYRKALQLFQDLPDVRLSLAKLYIHTNNLEKAKNELELLIKIDPIRSDAHTWLGVIYYKLEKLIEARTCWQRAIKANPEDQAARLYMKISEHWHA